LVSLLESPLKKQLDPKIAAIVLVVFVVVIGAVLFKMTGGPGSLPVGTTLPGNAGPFDPGGAANGKGGMPGK
jgi:hypothetical protein